MAKKYTKLGKILKKLLFDKEIRPADLSREVKIPPPTIHRLITGKSTRPYKSSLKPIAEFFSITVDQLTGKEPLSDFPTDEETNKLLAENKTQFIPLIPWTHLNFADVEAEHDYKKIAFIGTISKNGFATIMQDSSMEPLFTNNSILIFDPSLKPYDRSYVLIKLHTPNIYVFRQLLVDLDHNYLKSLDPNLSASKIYLLNDKDQIIAPLIESRNNYQPNQSSNNLITETKS